MKVKPSGNVGVINLKVPQKVTFRWSAAVLLENFYIAGRLKCQMRAK